MRVTPAGKVVVVDRRGQPGAGACHGLAQIAADALGVGIDQISVKAADTAAFPLGISTIASRIAVTAGSSVEIAAREVRSKALKVAAHMMEVSESDLEIENGVGASSACPG